MSELLSLPKMIARLKAWNSDILTTGTITAAKVVPTGLTGATSASRYVGATTSGAPASGTFVVGDFAVAQNGHIWVCTSAGSPGTWTDAGSAATGIAQSIVDVKGDLIVATAADTVARKAVGTDGLALVADSSQSDGLNYITPDAKPFAVKTVALVNITLSGTQTVNGVSLSAGDVALCIAQTTASQNGIYVVASGAWTRHTQFNSAARIAGVAVRVLSGTTDGGFVYTTSFKSTDTLDTTSMVWSSPYSDINPPATLNQTTIAASSVSTPPAGQTTQYTPDGKYLLLKDSGGANHNLGPANARAATTANITLSGTQTVDGVSLAAGDLCLVKNQTTTANNGLYVVSASTWTRAPGFDAAATVAESDLIVVTSGTVNGGLIFTTSFKSTDTLGTTAQLWLPVTAGTCEAYTFFVTGTVAVATGHSKIYIEGSYVVESIRAVVNTAPTGASLICDVNKNGTTVYTTQGNRPTIAISGTTSTNTAPDVTTFAAGDLLSIDVDQVGSSVAGADLTVTVRLRRVS